VRLMQQGRLALAGAEITAHLAGSVILTMLGIATVTTMRRLFQG
jgi:fluoride ion exporter CrcB/FEX